jgi:hypothetical protein
MFPGMENSNVPQDLKQSHYVINICVCPWQLFSSWSAENCMKLSPEQDAVLTTESPLIHMHCPLKLPNCGFINTCHQT